MEASATRSPAVADPALSDAVRLVAARVADTLSQPLTSLSLRLEVMLAEAGDSGGAGTADDLRALHRNAQRLVHLVHALRSYSRDGLTGWGPVRLNEVVSRAHAAAGVPEVSLVLDREDPVILGDAAPLERFVARALAEACGMVRDGHGVRLETRLAEGEPEEVALAISGVERPQDLAETSRHLLPEHAGRLGVQPLEGRPALVVTFPRLTLLFP